MKQQTKTWSERLQHQTREALSEMWINPDGKLHFKNYDNRGAFMTAQDVLRGKLSLIDKEHGPISDFADVDELLGAGWAID